MLIIPVTLQRSLAIEIALLLSPGAHNKKLSSPQSTILSAETMHRNFADCTWRGVTTLARGESDAAAVTCV